MDPWTKPQFDLSNPKLSQLGDQAWQAVHAYGEHMHPLREVFLLGDRLVRVSKDDGATKLAEHTVSSVTRHLDRIADCGKWTKVAGTDPPVYAFEVKSTPTTLARDLLDRTPDELPGAPKIARVVDVPVFGRDREVIFEPGYHESAQTYYEPAADISLADVRHGWETAEDVNVSEYGMGYTWQQLDVQEALKVVGGVFRDFPFRDEASRVHALCMMLEPFARELIGNKPTPMYAVTADLPNTGKTLLVQAALYPACAERTGVMTYTRDTESLRKLLTSALVEGGPAIWLDNVPKGETMDSAVLMAGLTAPTARWDDRILGHTKMASVPIRNVWVMTGNKPSISGELARRMIPIRLSEPRPDEYTFALGLDDTWLEENRGTLVQACLTLVANYLHGSDLSTDASGAVVLVSPQAKRIRRTYTAWSRVMGGIVAAAGLGDHFLANLQEFETEAAHDVQDDAGFLRQWYDVAGSRPLKLPELLHLIATGTLDGTVAEPIELPLSLQPYTGEVLKAKLGAFLRDTARAGDYRVVKHGKDSPHKWGVEKIT